MDQHYLNKFDAFFIAYLGLFLMKFGEWLKQSSVSITWVKTLELVVESESIFNSNYYDLISIPRSSNPVMAEERTHSRARE
jgi:hypothetical protein